jgi:hypothetical protein
VNFLGMISGVLGQLSLYFVERLAVNYPVFCRGSHSEFSGYDFGRLRSVICIVFRASDGRLFQHFVRLLTVNILDILLSVPR